MNRSYTYCERHLLSVPRKRGDEPAAGLGGHPKGRSEAERRTAQPLTRQARCPWRKFLTIPDKNRPTAGRVLLVGLTCAPFVVVPATSGRRSLPAGTNTTGATPPKAGGGCDTPPSDWITNRLPCALPRNGPDDGPFGANSPSRNHPNSGNQRAGHWKIARWKGLAGFLERDRNSLICPFPSSGLSFPAGAP